MTAGGWRGVLVLGSVLLVPMGCRKGEPEPTGEKAPKPTDDAAAKEPAVPVPAEPTPEDAEGPAEPEAMPEATALEADVPPAGQDVLATRDGVSLPAEATREDIERLWPGVVVHQDPDIDALEVFGPKRELLLRIHRHDFEELCITGHGVADAKGLAIGTTLGEAKLEGSPELRCEIDAGYEILRLGDPCPGLESLTLVCDLEDGRRLFFGLDRAQANRTGEEVRSDGLAALAKARLLAVLIGASTGFEEDEPVGIDDGDEPDDDDRATVPPTELGPVLARTTTDPPIELRAGMIATKVALEAALPGFEARRRRNGGFNLHLGETKVVELRVEPGTPITSATLVGPGMVDSAGIETGIAFDVLAKLPDLRCVAEPGEDCHMLCDVEGSPSTYWFDQPCSDALMDRAADGELTHEQVKALVGRTPLGAIGVNASGRK